MAWDRSDPERISPMTDASAPLRALLSACSQRISRLSSSGIPAETMVASCRVNSSSSPFFGLGAAKPRILPPSRTSATSISWRFLRRTFSVASN